MLTLIDVFVDYKLATGIFKNMDYFMMQPKFLPTYLLLIMGLLIAYPYFLSSGSFTLLLA